ncbi:hypothetical protein GA0070618_4257 [Micromonospora echinospora]|uniref:Uncharacterized protein n=1 Tax=Micromonospora echinospora TaxID=1877 RepID=A0A1C4YR48_MICEC|nr:hypothetical protein GA0070618_4257 [Micromonospora echinospora]
MVVTEHPGTGRGDPLVVAASLVAVTEFLRDGGEVERDRHHQRVGVPPAALPGGERLLQDPSCPGRVVGLPVQPGEEVGGAQQVRVVLAQTGTRRLDGVREKLAGAGEVTSGA